MKQAAVAFGLALMIGGCAAKEPPAPPPLRLAVKAPKPKPDAPARPTSADSRGAAVPGPGRDQSARKKRQVASVPDAGRRTLSLR